VGKRKCATGAKAALCLPQWTILKLSLTKLGCTQKISVFNYKKLSYISFGIGLVLIVFSLVLDTIIFDVSRRWHLYYLVFISIIRLMITSLTFYSWSNKNYLFTLNIINYVTTILGFVLFDK
jgi:hypothetical protein